MAGADGGARLVAEELGRRDRIGQGALALYLRGELAVISPDTRAHLVDHTTILKESRHDVCFGLNCRGTLWENAEQAHRSFRKALTIAMLALLSMNGCFGP